MMQRLLLLGGMAVVFVVASGCARYYRVTDPATGRDYYTNQVRQLGGGAVQFNDARTGGKVTIQNSEVSEVNQQQFDAGRYQTPASSTPAGTPQR